MESVEISSREDCGSYEKDYSPEDHWNASRAIGEYTRLTFNPCDRRLDGSPAYPWLKRKYSYETSEGYIDYIQLSIRKRRLAIIQHVMLKNWGPDEWKLVNSLEQL